MSSTLTESGSYDLVALNADVVGYSRLLADDFANTASVMEDLQQLVAKTIGQYKGTLVNFVGDNFMAVFEKATDAMGAAISITSDIESRNAEIANRRQVRFRMGLDQGEVVHSEGQWFGDALNIAARIQAIAPPGGVSVSGSVYKAMDEPALRFQSTGLRSLKNIPEEIEVFQFADLPSVGAPSVGGSGLGLDQPTVAVLPIHTETVGEELAAAGQMIRDDVLFRLAEVRRLRVKDAGRSGERPADNVRYLLETGVHQIGDQVRIHAKLMDVSTMNVVAINRWTAPIDGLMELSDQVADGVARSLEVELVIGEPARFYSELEDPEAIQNIYEGWYYLTAFTPEAWQKAIEAFTAVAKSHPDQAYGHVLGGFAKWLAAAEGLAEGPEQLLREAFDDAQKGIDQGDQTGLAQMVQAAVFMSQGHPEKAAHMVDNLTIQRPTCDVTYAVEGSVRRYMGEWEKSVGLLDRAMRLTPVNNPWYPTVQACSLYMGGRIDQAAATAEAVLEHRPDSLEALLILTAAQVELGLERRARATAELIRDRFPSVDVEAWLAGNPYQKPEMVERWTRDLTLAGVLTEPSG